MHEMGIALQLISVVEQSLPPGEALRVKIIRLRLGKLTAVVPASLRMCMEVAAPGTVAEGAELEFREIPVSLTCRECQTVTTVEAPPFVCGKCGGIKVDVTGGREMVVESLEVEEISAPANEEKKDAD